MSFFANLFGIQVDTAQPEAAPQIMASEVQDIMTVASYDTRDEAVHMNYNAEPMAEYIGMAEDNAMNAMATEDSAYYEYAREDGAICFKHYIEEFDGVQEYEGCTL